MLNNNVIKTRDIFVEKKIDFEYIINVCHPDIFCGNLDSLFIYRYSLLNTKVN